MTQATRKRSYNIDLKKMRKGFAIKPLALGVTSVLLSACGSEREVAEIYTSIDDCTNQNPEFASECKAAYQQALDEATRTGPRYNSARDCEYDFGTNQCQVVNTGGGSFFMPFMAGYMLSSLMSPRGYYPQPLFTSYSRYSPYRYHWMGAGGVSYGDNRYRKIKVDKKAFKPKPAVTKTIKRGGFGSSVRAKSNWGSSRRGSWGG